ncbi:MAG: DMT family transporter [Microbacteriaceae bacterium]
MGEYLDAATSLALTPRQFIGIPIALIGAVFLSLGAQFQSRGVGKVEANTKNAASGLNLRQLQLLLSRPSWVFGTLMLGLAIVLQLSSLYFSPLIVVQPLGAVALVITSLLNARITKSKLNRRSIVAVCLCVGGVGLFVTIAAFSARDVPIGQDALIQILIILAIVLAAFVAAFVYLRHRFKAIFYVIGAGVLYGFVATLAKVVIARLTNGHFEWLTILCLGGLLLAVGLGAYFVQNAYSSGPPDLVIAGLTVIDPMVAVAIGIFVLNEAAEAPWWAGFGFVIAGMLAIRGVFMLAKHHPQST